MAACPRPLLLAALALTPGCFLAHRETAKMCRSVAAYPLACPPDRVRAHLYRPAGSFSVGGQEVRSLCVADQEGHRVVCTETDGSWECSDVFSAGR